MKKKVLALLMMMTMVFLLAGCDKEEPEKATTGTNKESEAPSSGNETTGEKEKSGDDISISVVYKTLNSEYWGNVKDGAQAAADELGIECTILGATNESAIQEQVTILEDQISVGIDALVVAPIEKSAVIGALEPYVDSVPIVFVDSDADLAGKKAFIGTGNTTAAKLGGEYIAGLLGEGSKVVLMGGQQGEGTSTERLLGFEQAMQEAGIDILETQYGGNVADSAMAVMEDMLTKYPGEINAVLSMNDDMALGCIQAIEGSGEENIMVIGFDGNAAALEAIQAGSMTATVAQQPYAMGYQAVMQAYQAAIGNEIDAVQEVDVILIDKDNVGEYLK